MGATASVEALKPVDASDISASKDLSVARGEVMRLREAVGAFAKGAGFAEVVYDASDLVLGEDESEDFDRCVNEVKHIRAALHLSTQATKRRARPNYAPKSFFEFAQDQENDEEGDSESSDDEVTGDDEVGDGGIADTEKSVAKIKIADTKITKILTEVERDEKKGKKEEYT